MPGAFLYDNTSPWSGDHVSLAPSAALGVLLSSRPLALTEGPVHARSLAPTILTLLGRPVPRELDRPPLRLAE